MPDPQSAFQDPPIGTTIGAATFRDPPVGSTTAAPSATPPASGLHTALSEIGNAASQLVTGAAKETGQTGVRLSKAGSWLLKQISGVDTTVLTTPVLDKLSAAIGEPEGGWQKAGGVAANVGAMLVPAGEIGAASKAAEGLVEGGGALAKMAARAIVQGGTNAAIASAQGASPTVAGVAGAVGGATEPLAASLAERMADSAKKTMIRALGPAGGRGPTGAENLAKAEQLAPSLLADSFRPLSQDAASTQAAQALKTTGQDLKQTLQTVGGQSFDQPKLLQALQAKRDSLLVTPAPGQTPILPQGQRAADAIYAELASDVAAMGPTPSAEGIHALKSKWNDIADFSSADPAATAKTTIYKAGGDLIRAQLKGDAPEIAAADQAYSKAKSLSTILNAATTRRPDAGMMAALSPYAAKGAGAALGGAEGYREGGAPGAVAGAVAGYQLTKLLQSPGFRYVSANLKNQLANALDQADTAKVTALVASLLAQTDALARAQGKQ